MRAEGFDAAEIAVSADLLVGSAGEYRVHPLDYRPGEGVSGVPAVDGAGTCVRLYARGDVPKPSFERSELADPDPSASLKGERDVFWTDGFVPTPTYQREDLVPGNVVEGPAVVEAVDTTVAVPPERTFSVDAYGNGVIEF